VIEIIQNINLLTKIVAGTFLLSILIQLFYYWAFYLRLVFFRKKERSKENNFPPLSVVICAKDEETNLKKHLPSILTQDYPNYEVIVVNDCSDDFTEVILDNFKKEYPHLRSTKIFQDAIFKHGKKLAVTIGIKSAIHEWVVFTDADCQATSNQWLKELSYEMTENNSIVIGYGGYFKEKGFVNRIIRTDTLFNTLNYISFGLAKKPYMGIGRNLAYKKSEFFANKGFARHYHLQSGDDDLFINEVANKNNTKIALSPQSFTQSVPKKSFSAWIQQKRRHLSTSKYYRKSSKFLLGTEALSRFLFYLSFVMLLVLNFQPIITLCFFAFRLINQLIIFIFTAKKLNEKGLWLFSIMYDILQLFVNAYLMILNRIKPAYFKWK